MIKRICFTCSAFIAMSMFVASLNAEQPSSSVDTINRFIKSIEGNESLEADAKQEAIAAVSELRDDPFATDAAITEGLALIYPEFTKALELVGLDETEKAIEAFEKLTSHENKFLAAEAKYFIARAHMYEENYESALPVLEEFEKTFAKDSVQHGNATYLKGIAQANTLQNEEALKTLAKFLKEFPDASERMRVGAMRQFQIIASIKEGTLSEVLQRMEFSRRRLTLERTDQQTKMQQDEIVKSLDQLIKKAEEQEKKGECNCKGSKEGEQKPSEGGSKDGKGKSNNGQGSKNPDGFAKRTFGAGKASEWSKLRERERDPAFNAIKEKFPAKYRELVEKYYKSFQ